MTSETLHFENARLAQQLYNHDTRNLQALESQLGVKATSREGWIKLEGQPEAIERAKQMFLLLENSLKAGSPVRNREFASALAVAALKEEKVSRIILTRPAVEAGEALGFLPGDLYEKITPYLRPLHDALQDMLPAEEIQKHMERNIIEIAPLAYMRGRTLNHAFIILDEAQNSTAEQMFMFLTRLGMSSKAVITGDETQTDLPPHKQSGLVEAHRALRHTEGIAIVELTRRDVVRHPLVQRIILAYEEHRGKAQ
jgi:phosphate starvation-inducible protein PhoH